MSELPVVVRDNGNPVANDPRPILEDMEGRDALNQSVIDTTSQVTKYATAALPMLLRKAIYLVNNSENEKSVLESMNFIHKLAQGKIDQKVIDGAVRKMDNAALLEELDVGAEINQD